MIATLYTTIAAATTALVYRELRQAMPEDQRLATLGAAATVGACLLPIIAVGLGLRWTVFRGAHR